MLTEYEQCLVPQKLDIDVKTWWYIFEKKRWDQFIVRCTYFVAKCWHVSVHSDHKITFIYFSHCTVIIPSVSHITEYHNDTYDNKSYLGIILNQLALQQIVANLLDLILHLCIRKPGFVAHVRRCPLCRLVSTTCLALPYKCWNKIYI